MMLQFRLGRFFLWKKVGSKDIIYFGIILHWRDCMPRKNVTAYDLLISCPGDVSKYVDVVRECIESFNITIGRLNSAEIVGQHWSTSSFSQSGDRPQEILNKQFVRDCDAAVAIFWTRFGTPTDKYGSGTEEEIEEMRLAGKQVFTYFVTESVDLNKVDLEQYKKVQDFKAKYEGEEKYGTYFTVGNVEELRKLFSNHLTMYFLPIIMGEKEVTTVPAKKSKLNIQDYNSTEEGCAAILHSDYLNGKFVTKMETDIVQKIEKAKSIVLPSRVEEVNCEEKATEIEEKNDKVIEVDGAKLTLKDTDFFKGLTSNAEIREEWKDKILSFANRLGVVIDDTFWNVGNLTISKSLLNPMLGGGSSLNGSENEKQHYSEIKDIYWKIEELDEYREFLGVIDSYKIVELVLANDGTTFDEDIDVKLHVGKGNIVKKEELPIPGILTIDDFIEMQFTESVFKMRETDSVIGYVGYPMLPPRINYRINTPFNQPSAEEEYEDSKQKYEDSINQIFCYEIFEKEDEDVLVIHLGYLKHNTKMALPSVLVFKNAPDTISYEISSKHTSEMICGVLKMS
nr:MAG TPA: protein of unknown function (DUF4062) [Caudoviricetes sp.]